MNNAKSTRRAFLSSIVALLLCLTMLMGTTFAWFTDTAKVNVNTIQSGTLKIDIQTADGTKSVKEGTLETIGFKKSANAPEGEAVLWEPGCSYELESVKLVNTGNLHAKFLVTISAVNGANDGDIDLAAVIDVYEGETKLGTLREILDMGLAIKEGDIAPNGGEAAFGTITLKMQTTANNDYQNKSITDIAVTVYATQYTAEYDSTTNRYDANAQYDFDIAEEDAIGMLDDGGEIDFKGATLYNGTAGDNNYGANLRDYTFKAGTVIKNLNLVGESSATRWLHTEGDVTFENCTFNAEGIYAAHFDSGVGIVTFKNCTFSGWSSFGKTFDKIVFENCTFNYNGNYGFLRVYCDASLTNCTFAEDFTRFDNAMAGITITLDNCTGYEGKLFCNGDPANMSAVWLVDGVDISHTVP